MWGPSKTKWLLQFEFQQVSFFSDLSFLYKNAAYDFTIDRTFRFAIVLDFAGV